MENNLLESRLNKILTDKKFSKLNKSIERHLNKETGIFIKDCFLVLEFESVDEKTIQSKKKELLDNSMHDHIEKDDDSVQYFALYLWIFNLTAGQFLENNENKLATRIPVNLQSYNMFNAQDQQIQSAQSTIDKFGNVFCMSKKIGEQSLQIINSNIDEYQIAIYSEKQIFVGHIENIINSQFSMQNEANKNAFTMYRVQLFIQKYSPSILSIKFHKLSPHHLAVLLEDQYFCVYNLQSSLSYQEVQFNLQQIPRFGRNEDYNYQEKGQVQFVDFEFGGNSFFTSKSQTHLQIPSDFDFLSVYFLTEDGKIYYQSPFLVKDMRINRQLIEELKDYLLQEIQLVEKHEQMQEKSQLLKSYSDLVEQIESRDLISECEQPTKLSKILTQVDKPSTSEVPIFNSISMQDLQNENFQIQLRYVPTEQNNEEDQEYLENNSNKQSQFKSSGFGPKSSVQVFSKSLIDRFTRNNKNQIMYRKYCKFHKVETKGQLHVFILTKQIGNKTYSTVSSRFSPLPVMPTHIVQDFYQFCLLSGEKAHLECPLNSQINYTGNQSRKNIYEYKQNQCARLCSKAIETSTLDSVCFQLMNRIYCINFKWIQNLILTNLSDPKVFNDEELSRSEIRVLVDSHQIDSQEKLDACKLTDLSFYCLSEKDRMLLAVIPSHHQQQQQPFRLKCFTLDFFSNYIQIQKSAKIISETLHKMVKAQIEPEKGLSNRQSGQPLAQNDVKLQEIADKDNKVDLDNFQKQVTAYISKHEEVLQQNIQLIQTKYQEVLKKKEEMKKTKEKTETQFYEIIENKQKKLLESKKRIEEKNESIAKKIQSIAQMLKDPQASKQLETVQEANITFNGKYTEQTQQYYNRLKGIEEQYQKYFKTRSEFFDSLGGQSNTSLKIDESTLQMINETRAKLKNHMKILDNQIVSNKSQDI
ncbi:hypothetical protein ABPG72_011802 [Tetrahymena utriculariae]